MCSQGMIYCWQEPNDASLVPNAASSEACILSSDDCFSIKGSGLIAIAFCSIPLINGVVASYLQFGINTSLLYKYLTPQSFMEAVINAVFVIQSIKTYTCYCFLCFVKVIMGSAICILDEFFFFFSFPQRWLINNKISQSLLCIR